ncbi:hypothetical protein J6590_092605 [Homalodisca vitripennis]|nr:hypothetical protein J6590_092605 [Homalodisca vitripennis]
MDTDGVDLVSALKQINIKDVIYMTAESYDKIPSTTFVKSWRKAWPDIEKLVNGTVNEDLIQEWVTGDDNLENEYLSDEQIVQSVVEEYENEEAEKSDDDTSEEDKISHEEARNALQTSLAYIDQ